MSHLQRYILAVTAIGLILATIVLRELLNLEGFHFFTPRDFLSMWGGPLVAGIDSAALFDTTRFTALLSELLGAPTYEHHWSYPPYALFAFAPFSWLPYPVAFALFTGGGIALFLLAFCRALPARPTPLMLLCVTLAPACVINYYSGQNGLYIAALGLFALLQLEKRPALAGILIGILAIKPHLGLLWPILLIATRSWRAFTFAALTVLLLVAASYFVYGPEFWSLSLTHTAQFQTALTLNATEREDGTYLIMHLMMTGVLPALRMLGASIATATAAQLLATLATVIGSYLAFRRAPDVASRAVILGAGMLLASPYGFNYDMGLLTLGLLLHWHANPPTSIAARWLGGICYLYPFILCKLNGFHLPLAPLLMCVACVLTITPAMRARA